jgi:hypothetical protein
LRELRDLHLADANLAVEEGRVERSRHASGLIGPARDRRRRRERRRKQRRGERRGDCRLGERTCDHGINLL